MAVTQSNNKRIAKNTVALYVRMLVSTLVSLYTSRVVLDVLGVEDFGVFGVVGGIVGMIGFLNASMAGSTSRYLTYELAKNNPKKLNDTFSSAIIIHALIALIVVAFCETIGLWFLNNKLVIPDGRMEAAHWVLHFSVLGTMLSIVSVPYNALVFAHEKMGLYAYVEIFKVVLRLLILYVLVYFSWDKLILYSFLHTSVQVIILLIYFFYCICNFKESHFSFVWDKSLLIPLLSFSGWNMFKNICVTLRRQGTNFIVNIFFGVSLNAASSVATNVDGVFKGLTDSVVQASSPQIIKLYANGQLSEMQLLMIRVFKLSSVLMGLILCPLFVCINDVLYVWLKNPPEYSDVFVRFLLISSFFAMVSNVLFYGIMATGKIKYVSIVNGCLYAVDVLIVYYLFRLGCGPESSYLVFCVVNSLVFISDLLFLKKNINSIKINRFILCLIKAIGVILISSIPTYFIYNIINGIFPRIIGVTVINTIVLITLSGLLLFDKNERIFVLNYLKNRMRK